MLIALFASLLLSLLFCSPVPSAGLSLSPLFSSHMVLQRKATNSIWGNENIIYEPDGDLRPINITVQMQLKSHSQPVTVWSMVQTDGSWRVSLPQLDIADAPITMTIQSTEVSSIIYQFTDILVGDVFICSGQSNMEMRVADAFNASTEAADSVNYPSLRVFSIARNEATHPVQNISSRFPAGQLWLPVSPQLLLGDGEYWSWFSATCYFAGRDMYRAINDNQPPSAVVPIGLIESCWGGTSVEAWMGPDAVAQCPHENSAVEKFAAPAYSVDSAAARIEPLDYPHKFSVLWNAMISPILPLAVRGFFWYQGEANCGNAPQYGCRFRAMINDWRAKFTGFSSAPLPFMFVVLASTPSSVTGCPGVYPAIRAQQLSALMLPNTAAASAIDLGDLQHPPLGSIHPRNKQAVGRRLAGPALFLTYGIGQVGDWEAPMFLQIETPSLINGLGQYWWTAHFSVAPTSNPAEQGPIYSSPTSDSVNGCKNGAVQAQLVDAVGNWFTLGSASLQSNYTANPNGGGIVTVDFEFLFTSSSFPSGPIYPMKFSSLSHAQQDYVDCVLRGANGLPVFPQMLYSATGDAVQAYDTQSQ